MFSITEIRYIYRANVKLKPDMKWIDEMNLENYQIDYADKIKLALKVWQTVL